MEFNVDWKTFDWKLVKLLLSKIMYVKFPAFKKKGPKKNLFNQSLKIGINQYKVNKLNENTLKCSRGNRRDLIIL